MTLNPVIGDRGKIAEITGFVRAATESTASARNCCRRAIRRGQAAEQIVHAQIRRWRSIQKKISGDRCATSWRAAGFRHPTFQGRDT